MRWNEPDILPIGCENSLEKYNEAFELRRWQYDYDENDENLSDVKHIVDALNDKGYFILKDVVDKNLLKQVRDDANKIWDEGEPTKEHFSQLNKPDDAFQLSVKEPLYNCPSTVPLIFNDISMLVATAFFECFPAIGTFNLRKSFVNQNVECKETQLFHIDRNCPRIMKTFMYLNDVDEDGGPFCYVEGSRKLYSKFAKPGRIPDEYVEKNYGKDNIKLLTANMGDMIITNQTGAFHKGLKPTKNERMMLTSNWVIHSEGFHKCVMGMRQEDYDNLPDYKKPLADFLQKV